MDIEAAMKLKKPKDLLRACQEAERRKCEPAVIRELYRLYDAALDKQERERLERLRRRTG